MQTIPFRSPEERLVFLACRDRHTRETSTRLRKQAEACHDPTVVARICKQTHTWALVSKSLAQLNDASPMVTACLNLLGEMDKEQGVGQYLRLAMVREQLRTVLRNGRFPYAFFRGISFAEQYYTSPRARISADLDLLIPEGSESEVLSILCDSGFEYGESPRISKARANYMGQVELIHHKTGVGLDVNWRLSGNAGIGQVSQDMREVWRRMAVVRGAEHALCHTDSLCDLVRHVCHGHDFGRGGLMLRACADVHGVLATSLSGIDWDYAQHQVETGRYQRGWHFFAHLYNHFYRGSDEAELAQFDPPRCSAFERRLFLRWVIMPRILSSKQDCATLVAVLHANHGFMAKMWAVDELGQLAKLIKSALWPSIDEWRLLTRATDAVFGLRQRLAYWAALLAGGPGFLAGGTLRLLLGRWGAW